MTKLIKFVLVLLLINSCHTTDVCDCVPPALPVYNQAYQENYQADTINSILINANNAYVLVDPFADGVTENITAIKDKTNQVAAYISIGTGENYRDDFELMQPFLVTTSWGQWPDEYFVNSVTTGLLPIMKARIDKIAAWGCDWVEFDNMDWIYDDDLRATYGFEVTQAEGIAYYQELCDYVHEKGMLCMAKNLTLNAQNFDGVLYESFNNEKNWWDVSGAQNFVDQNKLVIINHYNETNCDEVYQEYKNIYGQQISYICEDRNLQKYKHYNQ